VSVPWGGGSRSGPFSHQTARPPVCRPTREFTTSDNDPSKSAVVDALLMHPATKDLSPCRVRVTREGLLLSRLSGQVGAASGERRTESAPIALVWRSLRGFSADESYATPQGPRLQVLEIDSDDGVLTLLAGTPAVSELFASVRDWSQHWRIARSPLGMVFGARRRHLVSQVA
jgi:hypothetical protein